MKDDISSTSPPAAPVISLPVTWELCSSAQEQTRAGNGDSSICAMVKSRYIGDGHRTFNRNPYNGYINPYYWVDDHPLLYGNNGSLDHGTYGETS